MVVATDTRSTDMAAEVEAAMDTRSTDMVEVVAGMGIKSTDMEAVAVAEAMDTRSTDMEAAAVVVVDMAVTNTVTVITVVIMVGTVDIIKNLSR